MKTNIKLLAFGAVATLMCATSCAKQDQITEAQSDQVSLINFLPEWDEGIVSKAETPVGAGLKITMGIAKRETVSTPKPLNELTDFTVVNKKYISNEAGMSPEDGKTLSLGQTATYDFYALAENNAIDGQVIDFAKPSFASAQANAFYSISTTAVGKDYIGAAIAKSVVVGQNTDMALPLKHLMSKIKIVFIPDASIEEVEFTSVKMHRIEASGGGGFQVCLRDGAMSILPPTDIATIVRSSSTKPMTSCGIDEELSYYSYSVPVATLPQMFYLELHVTGTTKPVGAATAIPMRYEGATNRPMLTVGGQQGVKLEAGKEYVYKVQVKTNEISFVGDGLPEVNDWTTGQVVILNPSDVL